MDIKTEMQAEKSDLPIIKQKLKIYQITVIFSLFFALIGFSYNVWRMEVSEANSNIREASFEMLLEISQFQQLIYVGHHDKDMNIGNPRKGWVKVLLINDLSHLTTISIEEKTKELIDLWGIYSEIYHEDREALDELDNSIDLIRLEIKNVLKTLD